VTGTARRWSSRAGSRSRAADPEGVDPARYWGTRHLSAPLAGVPHALVILELPECRSRCSWTGLVSISVVPFSEADLNHLT
jgi:hypothetical protein